jgi:hypothetical protein
MSGADLTCARVLVTAGGQKAYGCSDYPWLKVAQCLASSRSWRVRAVYKSGNFFVMKTLCKMEKDALKKEFFNLGCEKNEAALIFLHSVC